MYALLCCFSGFFFFMYKYTINQKRHHLFHTAKVPERVVFARCSTESVFVSITSTRVENKHRRNAKKKKSCLFALCFAVVVFCWFVMLDFISVFCST